MTGFRTYSEFVDRTTPLERRLIVESIDAWHEEQQGSGGGLPTGGGPAGL